MNWDIKSANKILYRPFPDFSQGGGTVNANSNNMDVSIFGTQRTGKNEPVDKTEDDDKIAEAASQELGRMSKQYTWDKQVKIVEKNEEILSNSVVPNLPQAGHYFKTEVDNLVKEIGKILEAISDKCSNCKTEQEAKSVIKEAEEEIKQKYNKINVLTQRSQKAVQLNDKLTKIYSDPEKKEIAEKIDINKITTKLTEPPEDIDMVAGENAENVDSSNTQSEIEEAVKDDEISNVIDNLIKYIDNGKKDPSLDSYIKEDNSSENNLFGNNNTNNNLFSMQINKKKNPFST